MTPPIEDVQPDRFFTCQHCDQPFDLLFDRNQHEVVCPQRPRNPRPTPRS